MRRFLLGGLGLALGIFTPTALAQQPAPTAQPARAAKLGRPVAIPAAPAATTDPAVTPAGLFRDRPAQQTVTYLPGSGAVGVGTPIPILTGPPGASSPTVPTPMPMSVPLGNSTPYTQPMGQPMGTLLPAPQPLPGGPPLVTETRDPTSRIPTGTIVPSVMPEDYPCPDPGLEDPLFGSSTGLDRVRGWGRGRNWLTAEVLLWWNKGQQLPSLVTTSSPQFNGIPGQGDTRTVLGGSFGSTFHVGGRIGGGHWFDDDQYRGLDWRLFWVAPASSSFSASSPPYTLLARPFFNVNPTTLPTVGFGPSAEVVAGPGVATGTVNATLKSTVWGAEANYRRFLLGDPCGCYRLDMLVGYRYLGVQEELTVTESFNRVPGSPLTVGTPVQSGVITDDFRTENHFHGGQIGLAGTVQRGRWTVNTRATIAFGTVFQSADINGSQTLVFPNGGVQTTAGGLLAVPGANIGHWTQNRFAVVPEIGLNLGYQVTSRLNVFVGYNFLYLSSALRPNGVIDPYIDAARVPNLLPAGTATPISTIRPLPQLHATGYFIQGINFGLMYRW